MWAAERAALLRDMVAAVQDKDATVRDKDATKHELHLVKRQAMDVALLLKEAVEVNSQIRKDLCI